MSQYFYSFLEPVSKELARTLKELEGAIYSSPRTMLTHSRTLIEAIMEKALGYEKITCNPYDTIQERIEKLDRNELISNEIKNTLHEIRKAGNIAAHDIREFKTHESLEAWERIYIVMKWYVETYGPYNLEFPKYSVPPSSSAQTYELEELHVRLSKLERLLKQSIAEEQTEQTVSEVEEDEEDKKQAEQATEEKVDDIEFDEPGLTTIRTIRFKDKSVDVPHFLRDAFLLPQRFEESESFLLKLNEIQESRIMSELPSDLDALPRTARRNDTHIAKLLDEISHFIEEEKRRRHLTKERPGELFLFYNGDQIIVTEELGKEAINQENFTGLPSLIEQLNAYGIHYVRDLPKELVTIGKYRGVGRGRIEQFFNQLVALQQRKIREQVDETNA